MIKPIKNFMLPLALVALLAACASQQPKQSGQPAPTATSAPTPAAVPEIRPAPQAAVGVNPFDDPNNILSKRSVYYDFDRSVIKPEFKPLIEAHARYLRDHPGASIAIQGNTDDLIDLVNLVKRGRVHLPEVQTRPLAMAEQSLTELAAGKIIGRVVLEIDGDA